MLLKAQHSPVNACGVYLIGGAKSSAGKAIVAVLIPKPDMELLLLDKSVAELPISKQ